MPIEKKYRVITIYPGVKMRDQAEALQRILRRRESSLSEVLRPALAELLSLHSEEIAQELQRMGKGDS